MIFDLDEYDVGGGGRRRRRGCGGGSFLEEALEGPLGGAAAHLGGSLGGGDRDRRLPEVIGDIVH